MHDESFPGQQLQIPTRNGIDLGWSEDLRACTACGHEDFQHVEVTLEPHLLEDFDRVPYS